MNTFARVSPAAHNEKVVPSLIIRAFLVYSGCAEHAKHSHATLCLCQDRGDPSPRCSGLS
jgi:hypothetical protein